MEDHEKRLRFAEFLRRLAAGRVTLADWHTHIVTHFFDDLLESIRRDVARLHLNREGGKEYSDSEIAALQFWSRHLRNNVKVGGESCNEA